MLNDDTRGNESPDRQTESTSNHTACPNCETPIQALVTRGPSEHFLDPCGCRVTTQTTREIAGGPERGRGVATDGGTSMSDTEQCFHPECDRRATAVYEGTVPPADVIRRKACWIHGAKATPVRFLDTETEPEGSA